MLIVQIDMHLRRSFEGVCVDGCYDIPEKNLRCESVSMVDDWLPIITIPTVN